MDEEKLLVANILLQVIRDNKDIFEVTSDDKDDVAKSLNMALVRNGGASYIKRIMKSHL